MTLTNNNGCTVTNDDITSVDNGDSCDFSYTYTDGNGDTVSVTGSVDGTAKTVTNVVATGGPFGAGAAAGGASNSGAPNTSVAQRQQSITSLQNNFTNATPSVLGTDGLGLSDGGVGIAGPNGEGIAFAMTRLPGMGFAGPSDNPMDRDFGAVEQHGLLAQNSGYGFTSNKSFKFSVGLQALAARARAREAERASKLGFSSGTQDGGYRPQSRWVTSFSGRYVDFDDDQVNADRSGHLWYVTSALGYRLSEDTTVGVFTRYRQGEVDSVALNSSLDATLWGGGVYLATTLGGGMRFIGAALYEVGDSDSTIAGATGSFDSETVTLEASLDRRITFGPNWIEPQLQLLYNSQDNDGFTDSLGNRIDGSTQELGRVSFGPRIGTSWGGNGTAQILPFAKIQGLWDFVHEDDVTVSTGAVQQTGETAVTLGGGVDVVLVSGVALRLAGDWFSYDTALEGWTFSGGIGGSFSAFGLADTTPGFVSLDFSGNAEGASAKARIRIPLGGARP